MKKTKAPKLTCHHCGLGIVNAHRLYLGLVAGKQLYLALEVRPEEHRPN